MILLGTHVWLWWVQDEPKLPKSLARAIERHQDELAISVLSCWEIAKLIQLGRVQLTIGVEHWIAQATAGSSIEVLPLSPHIAIEATRLPHLFRSDPVDEIIVATAIVHDAILDTCDRKILDYPGVSCLQ